MQVLERPQTAPAARKHRRIANFAWHFIEMCAAMCAATVVLTIPFVLIARAAGYGDALRQLPELATVIAFVAMSLGMAAQMRWRKHRWSCIAEMTAAMAIEAVVLIAVADGGVIARADLFPSYHALMPVAMIAAMLYRLDLYTRPVGEHAHRVAGLA